MKLVAAFAGQPIEIPEQGTGLWWDKPWESGFYKKPLREKTWLAFRGLAGDGQADRRVHGGADKALCAYPADHYPFWRSVLGLPDFPLGAFGENLSLDQATESEVCVGDVYSLGEALIEISQPRQPCWKLARRWRIKDLSARVENTGFSGYYFRVLRHGFIEPGQTLERLARPFPRWTVAVCNTLLRAPESDPAAALALIECAPLAAYWKDEVFARLSALRS